MKPLFGALAFVSLLFVSCQRGLPPSVQREIADENDKLEAVKHRIERAQEKLQNAQAPAAWAAGLNTAREKLNRAENDREELAELRYRDRYRVPQLLAEERMLRDASVRASDAVEARANKLIEFKRDPAASLKKMQREYEAIGAADLEPAAKTVARADADWPSKKSALDSRLASLREIPKSAETEWHALDAVRQDAASGKATSAQLVTLVEADDTLLREKQTLESGSKELNDLSGQLYDTWNKILTDLDTGHYGEDTFYRERIKTVRTHFTDVAAKKTETHSDEHWTNVSENSFRAVENDLGMAIAHKDAGLFDSEAENTPQPAGFAYVASPSQGSNQYGYWDHSHGESVWTFLPEYLLLRELLWNRDYRPVVVADYNGYRTAQRNGTSYYGRETPASPPKYGSHGTFTQTHYADSRYVQTGGFKGSAYASRNSPSSSFSDSHADRSGSVEGEKGAGRRFGKQNGSPSGERFGRSGGFRPGRSFGRRR